MGAEIYQKGVGYEPSLFIQAIMSGIGVPVGVIEVYLAKSHRLSQPTIILQELLLW